MRLPDVGDQCWGVDVRFAPAAWATSTAVATASSVSRLPGTRTASMSPVSGTQEGGLAQRHRGGVGPEMFASSGVAGEGVGGFGDRPAERIEQSADVGESGRRRSETALAGASGRVGMLASRVITWSATSTSSPR